MILVIIPNREYIYSMANFPCWKLEIETKRRGSCKHTNRCRHNESNYQDDTQIFRKTIASKEAQHDTIDIALADFRKIMVRTYSEQYKCGTPWDTPKWSSWSIDVWVIVANK